MTENNRATTSAVNVHFPSTSMIYTHRRRIRALGVVNQLLPTLHTLCMGTIVLCGHNAVIIYSSPHNSSRKTVDLKHHSFMSLVAVLDDFMYRSIVCQT